MRSIVATLALCAVVLVAYTIVSPPAPVSAADCGSCVPFRHTDIELSGHYHVCFHQNYFINEQAEKMTYGFNNYWGTTGVTFDWELTPFPESIQCDMVVDATSYGDDSIAAQAHPTSNGDGAGFTVNTSRLGRTGFGWYDYWARLGAHEMGHNFGFEDLEGNVCGDYSIMNDWLPSGYPSSALCSDLGIIQYYYEQDNDQDGYTPPDDCNDGANWINPGVGDPPACGHSGDWNCNDTDDAVECATPVVVDVLGNGIELTDTVGGVQFDFDGDGMSERVSWTAIGSDDAWLVLDRNDNGRIDSGAELFGNWTAQPESPAPNGFLALALFDGQTVGGNANGWFDTGDRYFDRVRLWRDSNHDGVSQPDELFTLRSVGLKSISLKYIESRRKDEWGNSFRYRARVVDEKGHDVGRFAYDVFLIAAPRLP